MANLAIVYRNPNIEWDRVYKFVTVPERGKQGTYLSFHDHSLPGFHVVEEQEWQVHRREN